MNRRFSLDSFASGPPASGRRGAKPHKWQKQVETLHEAQEKMKELHHSLNRDSLHGDPNIGDEGLNRSDGLVTKSSTRKHNETFHKLFDIPETELLKATFTCSLQKEVIYHGRLYVSDDHICFHSSVLLKHTKVEIPTATVWDVKKHKSPMPMLSIHTVDGGKYHLMYVKHSRTCYDLLQSVCQNVEKESANSSPHMSSTENGGNGMLSSHSSFDESLNSRKNSISLDDSYPNSQAFTDENTATYQDSVLAWEEETGSLLSETTAPPRKPNEGTFNFIFYVFCLLFLLFLLISGYIGLKIVALEEQLNALGELSF